MERIKKESSQLRQLEQPDRDTRHTLIAMTQSLRLPYVRAKKMKESRLLTEERQKGYKRRIARDPPRYSAVYQQASPIASMTSACRRLPWLVADGTPYRLFITPRIWVLADIAFGQNVYENRTHVAACSPHAQS